MVITIKIRGIILDKTNLPSKKDSTKSIKDKKIVNPLPIPEPHPEKTPPNIPIPGEPSGGEVSLFICKICGKHYDSKEEFELHMKMDHKSSKK